jgi:hypothetical protein
VSRRPPPGLSPPVLADLEFGSSDGFTVVSPGRGAATGRRLDDHSFRDCTIDVELGLAEGGEGDRYGVFFRQGAAERYVACTTTVEGDLAVGLVDHGPPLVVAEGPLPAEVPFDRGVGATNRLTIVCCGPAVAVVVNGVAVTGVMLDPRFVAGPAGALLVHTSDAPEASVVVRWAQVRAILPDQPDRATGA